jgi:GT2 family glycosyltransferase
LRDEAVAVRVVDVGEPQQSIDDVTAFERVRIYAQLHGRLLGYTDVRNGGRALAASEVRQALVDTFGVRLVPSADGLSDAAREQALIASLARDLLPPAREQEEALHELLDDRVSVSIVVATLDRPEDLRSCLIGLAHQATRREVEVVVVDNRPESGRTAPVLRDFPDVVLVEEPRRGLAYARNAGILAGGGEVIVMTDDDVRHPQDWLEKLIAPLSRNDVGGVTGNVLPLELDTRAQRLFETYGGLGKGFEAREADLRWFHRSRWAVPTWQLGATANAAFRASVFRDPEVGLMDEALGPGMPTGVGEDTYLFYKVLRSGYTMIYEPSAYVWHRHRPEMAALRRQLYAYSKGHVAYHLTTLLNDGDVRALGYLLVRLPYGHLRRMRKELLRRTPYPLKLHLAEIGGNIAGPLCLWQARRRVAREGRSSRSSALVSREGP